MPIPSPTIVGTFLFALSAQLRLPPFAGILLRSYSAGERHDQ
ncbi:hypothetical protein RPW65_17460 [Pseudomonas sp. NyZ704]|nr:hypothetical protein RPW65_17460 [Pseudomonas sp. NyZ704]